MAQKLDIRYQVLDTRKRFKPWFENKIQKIRNLSQHQAARAAYKYAGLAGVVAILTATLVSFFLPKDEFQLLKERLIRNPNNFEANLQMAEKFLENNQLEEAEKVLRLAQQHLRGGGAPPSAGRHLGGEMILGEQANTKLNELWQQKYYSDPEDIRRLIAAWEKIIEEKPNYRDGYLQLAILHYKLYENEKAKEYLQKALDLDPNYEPTRELERILNY